MKSYNDDDEEEEEEEGDRHGRGSRVIYIAALGNFSR